MAVFVDSGILLRAVHRTDSKHAEVREAIRTLLRQADAIFTGLQQLSEFWNVCTRPPGNRGGFDLSVEETDRRLRRIERGFSVLVERPVTVEIWKTLVRKHGVRGVQVHDARVVALMLTHSLNNLLTLNKADFLRYQSDGLKPMTPLELVSSTAT
jgi:predicted nucleic acid-binding protein